MIPSDEIFNRSRAATCSESLIMEEFATTYRDLPVRKALRHRVAVVWAYVVLLSFSSLIPQVFAQPTEPAQTGSPLPTPSPNALTQLSPTPDQDQVRLEKEKLSHEVEKLRIENENNKREFSIRGLVNLFYGNLSILLALALALAGLIKYFKEQKTTLRKREEERFENVVKSLGSQYEQERMSAAVLLPTFLSPEYRRFHEQVFNLAAGHLRMGPTGAPSPATKVEIPSLVRRFEFSVFPSSLEDTSKQQDVESLPTQLRPLTQPLANVLCESYRLIRDGRNLNSDDKEAESKRRRQINAFGVRMDGVDLSGEDLRYALMKQSSMRGAILESAFLAKTLFASADLSGATLTGTELIGATLIDANFSNADLTTAALDGANIDGANFSHARLSEASMSGASARGTKFDGADLSGANLRDVEFGPYEPTGQRSNPEVALTLEKAVFSNVTGLTDEQKRLCRSKGAIFYG